MTVWKNQIMTDINNFIRYLQLRNRCKYNL